MKLLLLGEHFSDNLGDGIISECFRRVIGTFDIEYVCFDLSGRKQIDTTRNNSEGYTKTKTILKKIKECVRKNRFVVFLMNARNAYKLVKKEKKVLSDNYDAAIYVGGSLFMGYFSVKQYFVNKELSRNNIPIYYNACGIGAFSSKLELLFMKKALRYSNIKKITVRDSYELIKELSEQSVKKTTDVAVLSNVVYKPSKTRDVVGIGIINLNEEFNMHYEKSLYKLIQTFEEHQVAWELFTNGEMGDYIEACRFFENISKDIKIQHGSVMERPINSQELVYAVTSYKAIITCRLHSAIIAYSFQIPTIAITWTHKVKEFYEDIGHRELLVTEDFDAELVYQKLRSLKYNDDDQRKLQYMQNNANDNIYQIITDIEEGIKDGVVYGTED